MSHFYTKTKDGVESRHYVPMAKDPKRTRPSRVTDLKKAAKNGEVWVPSVTTVMGILHKEGLVQWLIGQHLEQAHWVEGQDFGFATKEDYVREVRRITRIEMDKAPDAGTNFHKLMERYLKSYEMTTKDYQLCESVAEELAHKENISEGNVEVNFVSKGYGGQIDYQPSDWIIDWKTKETKEKFIPGKMAYEDHYVQLAAYREAVCSTARCANVFVCLETGEVDFHEHKEEDLVKGYEIFKHCLAIWQLQKGLSDTSGPV